MKLPEPGTYEFDDMTVQVGPHPQWKYFCALTTPIDSPQTRLQLTENKYSLQIPTNHDSVAGLAHIAMLGIVLNSVSYGCMYDDNSVNIPRFGYDDESSVKDISLMRRAELVSSISPIGLNYVFTGVVSISNGVFRFSRYAAWIRGSKDGHPYNHYILSGAHEHPLLNPELVTFIDSAVSERDRSSLPTLGFRLALMQEHGIDQYQERVEAERVLQALAGGAGEYAL